VSGLQRHNAGRSQLAVGGRFGGLEPEEAVRPVALSSLQELDTDRSEHEPIELTTELVQRAEVIVALKPGRHRSADGAEWAFMVGMMRFPPTRSRPCGA
jgi:hypothetical protein